MRLTVKQIEEITGLVQRAAQRRWFRTHFGVNLPCDMNGPIITAEAFNALVAKKCGLPGAENPRPSVKLKGEIK